MSCYNSEQLTVIGCLVESLVYPEPKREFSFDVTNFEAGAGNETARHRYAPSLRTFVRKFVEWKDTGFDPYKGEDILVIWKQPSHWMCNTISNVTPFKDAARHSHIMMGKFCALEVSNRLAGPAYLATMNNIRDFVEEVYLPILEKRADKCDDESSKEWIECDDLRVMMGSFSLNLWREIKEYKVAHGIQ